MRRVGIQIQARLLRRVCMLTVPGDRVDLVYIPVDDLALSLPR